MIEQDNKMISVRRQSIILDVNRSTLYYKKVDVPEDTALANEISELWMVMPFYGYRRITAELNRNGHNINRKRVRRMMREMNLEALYPRPKTTIKCLKSPVYPYLLDGLTIDSPNQVWSTDITYIKMPNGFAYLVAIIDVFSRYVLSWRISNTMDTSFCLEMLDEAVTRYGCPEIINTDQGSQFTSQDWLSKVKGYGIKVSMDGKGRWADNIFIERFWRTLKHEHILLHSFTNLRQVRVSIGNFVDLYNNRRLHQSLGYRTPSEAYGASSITKECEKTADRYACGYVDNLIILNSIEASYPTYPQAQQPQQP